ncbi:MAG: amidase [Bosea sp.]|uniref:amidase n=1 Tax=Bosea sp. (in: a-proteobacteria) TaxID=1871050 RepID=UPI001AC09343|nr:amidase [Bosea sp. (in: a-proteobacteria)]MBN9468733.1 amidase [Bosea sp. (in: a-proteobacteria)]
MIGSLAELRAALDEGRTTSLALVEGALSRAKAPEGEGARVFTALHEEQARAAARASDVLRQAGYPRSPIEGLPVSVKDLFDIKGETTRAGSVALDGAAPAQQDAPAVQRLVAAGAILIGRTNMTEFAFPGLGLNPHYGTPLNPFDRSTGRIPGGSSSGAAVSVTDGMAAAALGTDTGGSVRIPAAFCGLTGFKPTARRVSRQGAVPLSTSLDSVGPIAPTVACCATLDAILSGSGADVPAPASLEGLRLAVPTTLALDAMDATVAAAFKAALASLSQAGVRISEIAVPEFAALAGINARGGFTAAEAWHWHRELIEREGDRYDPRVSVRIRRGKELSAADYIDLLETRAAWITAVEARIAPFDALIMPTVPVIAPKLAELEADDAHFATTNLLVLRNATLINFLDGCALSLPCHRRGEAPVGLMLAAAGGQDQRVLAIGQAVEQALAAARA